MEFTPWIFFADLGFMSILLLIGTVLRAKVKLIQRFFIPASIMAGVIGLAFGPNGAGIIPFSNNIGTYPGILIALIFGSLPLTISGVKWSTIQTRVGSMWAYSQLSMILMWGGGLLFSLLVINPFWDRLHTGFGLILAAGFVGGHGTAAAIGDAFLELGWEEAGSLAMTSATVGVLAAIIFGIIFIKIGSAKGETSFLSSFEELPDELRTGLIPASLRKNVKTDTVSSMSIDPYIFHLALILMIALGGYYLSRWGEALIPSVSFPVFSLAFIVGFIVSRILAATGSQEYVSDEAINRISGSATDLLVAFGIASINISVVVENAIPLLLLFIFGLLYAYLFFAIVSKRFFPKYWFERGIFTWGWNTGTVAMGIALLNIVDVNGESGTLEDYGLAYIPIAPVEVLLITFAPLFTVVFSPYLFLGIIGIFTACILFICYKNRWFVRSKSA